MRAFSPNCVSARCRRLPGSISIVSERSLWRKHRPSRSAHGPCGADERFGNSGERENELQRIIEKRQRTEAGVPASDALVLRVDRQSDPTSLGSDRERAHARGQEQICTKAVTLDINTDRQTREPVHRHLVPA